MVAESVYIVPDIQKVGVQDSNLFSMWPGKGNKQDVKVGCAGELWKKIEEKLRKFILKEKSEIYYL